MRIVVIGCGSIGERHASNALVWGEVGIVDSNPARSQILTDKGAHAFTTIDEALDWSPDAIIIATPHDSHMDVAHQVLASEASILIEKPLTVSMDEAHAFLNAAREVRRADRIYGMCNLRFHAGPATLKANMDKIGKPLFARLHFGSYLPAMRPNRDYRSVYAAHHDQGGGVVLDTIHEIDLACWLMGEVEQVGGAAARLSSLEMDAEDFAEIHLAHASGARSQVHMDYLQRLKTRGCEIVGEDGTLTWRSVGKRPERMTVELLSSDETVTTLASNDAVNAGDMFEKLMEDFVQSVKHPASSRLQTLEEAVRALAVTLSMRMGPEVLEHWRNLGKPPQ